MSGRLEMDEMYMRMAMGLAERAAAMDEVPVGCLVVRDGEIVGEGYNRRETAKLPTAHAEIMAIEQAAKNLGGWRLTGCTLYVTLEPCAMCAGAIINARVPRVVYGASDLRFGAFGSLINLNEAGLNHTVELDGGVLKEECAEMLSRFFKNKRK